jgi:tRNA G10  N-methylase Trm11
MLGINMEVKISKASGLLVDRVKPDLEFWFLYRSEKIGFFMLRLTKHASTEKLLNKGELRPELSYTLCLISGPDDNDIFIDPFCGYGSIPMARSLISPADMIFAADIDKENVRTLKLKSVRQKDGRPVFVKHMDALNMKTFEDGFADKIVTDPPWGIYENVGMDIEVFYYQMMQEFYRILKINGIAVILTAKKAEFENVLLVFGNKLDLCKKYDILVSGKKASIYKVIKKH